ncbi:MAG: 3-deoxy-manno-octulosonate cytidylyltransferase [Acidiferrobacterales bacterium]|nr:3-deoxy-manno-octulosonate cytidylyltransferase [Acidiferrobacterales bacterium]
MEKNVVPSRKSMNCPFDIVIPARYHSSRMPGKLLEDICGKSMIKRVIERAKTSGAENVIVAYDDERIGPEIESVSGAVACKTSFDHPSGTDRVAEAVATLGLPNDRIVVNLQGDEPLIPPALIDRVAAALSEADEAAVATAAKPLRCHSELRDPNIVKCVVDHNSYALYFSRSAIPWHTSQTIESEIAFHHIGIYAYYAGYLVQHAQREVCPLEAAERLEQLRVMYNGDRIIVVIEESYESLGIDTPQDLEYARQLLADR